MGSERMRSEVVLELGSKRSFGDTLTGEVANQSCLKLAAPSAFMSPDRELAWSILARTCA